MISFLRQIPRNHVKLTLISNNYSCLSNAQLNRINASSIIIRWNSSKETPKSLADEILKKAQNSNDDKNKDDKNSGNSEESDDKSNYKPMTKLQKYGYAFFGISMIGALILNAVLFAMPDKDENGQVIEDEFSSLPAPSQYFYRLKNKIFKTKKDFEEPFSDKLLPDPLPEPYYQPNYTILIELTGLLVHSNWTHKHGWRFQKRPGVDMFISQIGYPNFELVVFTSENSMTLNPIIDGLDPQMQFIMYRLFRDATRYVNGHHLKDIKSLNRDPKKVIIVDWDKDAVSLNRENALILPKWEGDNMDRQLITLTQLLQTIKQQEVEDVREVLEHYRHYDDPVEAFREKQRQWQTKLEADEKEKEQSQKKGSFFSGMTGFGLKR